MKKINYKKYFSNILWFTSTNLLAFVFLIPSIIDLFREESSVAFGQLEEETEDSKLTRLLFRALTFFIHLLRAISGFILSMSASILDYSINFATADRLFILNVCPIILVFHRRLLVECFKPLIHMFIICIFYKKKEIKCIQVWL